MCTPARFVKPWSVEEVAEVVQWAAQQALPVRAVGAGHSFTPIVETTGVLLNLDLLSSIGRPTELHAPDPVLPRATHTITVGAGMRLRDLNLHLTARGFALANLGDIDAQSIAGAISTATHGTGGPVAGLSAQVRGVELVLASGQIIQADAQTNPNLFEAARVGLGTIGILTAVTLAIEPAYLLRALEEPWPLARALEELDDLTGLAGPTGTASAASPGEPQYGPTPDDVVGRPEHFEFYWFPHTRRTLTKRNYRTTHDDAPLHPVRAWFDDELLSNNVFEVINRLAARAPRATPVLNRISSRALSAREFTGSWYEVFATARRVRFRESEWAIPYAQLGEVLREIDAWINRTDARIAFPIEVRFAAPEAPWLSTAYGRATAYVAVHQFHRVAHHDYFAAVQNIMLAHDGRPHWGKMHTLGADYFTTQYPRLPDFIQVRAEHDPAGMFLNPYTRQILGV